MRAARDATRCAMHAELASAYDAARSNWLPQAQRSLAEKRAMFGEKRGELPGPSLPAPGWCSSARSCDSSLSSVQFTPFALVFFLMSVHAGSGSSSGSDGGVAAILAARRKKVAMMGRSCPQVMIGRSCPHQHTSTKMPRTRANARCVDSCVDNVV